jgi:hypothetical protein
VTKQEQLQWEARHGRLAAAAALGAVVFQIAALIVQIPALQDAPSRDEDTRYRESLVNIHEHGPNILASSILTGIASALTAGVLYYLYRATCHRRPQLPVAMGWVFLLIPVLVIVGPILTQLNAADLADRFFESGVRTNARAKALVDDNPSTAGLALNTAGLLSLAIGFVFVGMQAMRVGLLSRFLGVLAVVAGALMILPLVGLPIVQVFWLGAVGWLLLGRWPGGRGPAWESGEAELWPRPAGRGGLLGGAARKDPAPEAHENGDAPAAEPAPELEAAPRRPSSRKRKRKRG